MTSGGVMYGLELPEDARLEDDPLDGPFIEIVYRWAGSKGYQLEDSWVGGFHGPSGGSTLGPKEVPPYALSPQALGSDQGHAHA